MLCVHDTGLIMIKFAKSFAVFLLFFISLCSVRFITWFSRNFHSATFEQVIFFLNVPVDGAESEFVRTFYIKVLLFSSLVTLLFVILKFVGHWLAKRERGMGPLLAKGMPFYGKAICLISIVIIIVSGFRINRMFQVGENLRNQYNQEISQFYEKFYVDPQTAQIIPPAQAKKGNLIVVYLESMERTFSDEKLMSRNLIPHLSQIADENQSFSYFTQGYAQSPTQAALVSSMIGVPITYLMQIGRSIVVGGSLSEFAPNAFSIGQLLQKEGYQNLYVQGTSGRFSGTDVFLKSHGFDQFYDMDDMVSRFEGSRAKECLEAKVLARFYDEFTYDFFKEKIRTLPADKPFFAVMATIDTHFGNATPNSQKLFPTETENTIYHASSMAGQFLEWVRKQPFGENTTVVFIGDHLMMKVGGRKDPASRTFFRDAPINSRFMFNAFVNARKKAPDRMRHFTQVDIFPTLVESLGYEIKGGRLGLGTSLFSGRETLLEALGTDELDSQLRKKNLLYDALWESTRN